MCRRKMQVGSLGLSLSKVFLLISACSFLLSYFADGHPHVLMLETDQDDQGSTSKTFIRYETFNKMKAWMLDMLNEAQSFAIPDEEPIDWWTALFGNVSVIEPKSYSHRKDAHGGGKGEISRSSHPLLGLQRHFPLLIPCTLLAPAGDPHSSVAVVRSKPASVDRTPTQASSKQSSSSIDAAVLEKNAEDSDDESDPEDNAPKPAPSKTPDPAETGTKRLPTSHLGGKMSKNIKELKPEKAYGLPPFDKTTVRDYETPQAALTGLQISLRLCNICGFQDRIFVVVFGSVQPMSGTPDAMLSNTNAVGGKRLATSPTSSATGANSPGSASALGTGPGKWEQLCRTELRTVKQRLSYSENSLNDIKIHFNLIEPMIPEHYKSIRIVVYRQENDNGARDAKGNDLSLQSELARTALPRKIFDLRTVLKIKMKVKSQPPMDITVPLVRDPEAILGIVKLTSYDLNLQRLWFTKTLHLPPYAERLYSFAANNGMTMSLEQLYASRYSTTTAQALLSLWSAERSDYFQGTVQLLKDHFAYAVKEEEAKLRAGMSPSSFPSANSNSSAAGAASAGSNNGASSTIATVSTPGTATAVAATTSAATVSSTGESIEDRIASQFDSLRQSIEAIEELAEEARMLTDLSLQTCESVNQGKDVVNNVIGVESGGGVLRRSAWKKITAWQYCATNLNIHLLSSKFYQHADVHNMAEAETSARNMHVIPMITLGCPAAHELKFSEGGLRKIFSEIPTLEQKCLWMQALQYPTLELLRGLFETYSKEASALFGPKCSFVQGEELAALLRRKHELARRIDVCSSQALACALTSIRTVVMLAATGNGVFMDALGRSLKIGFLVMFQSMLSTQGAELGMIEDLEMAALWLSLVSVRIVSRGMLAPVGLGGHMSGVGADTSGFAGMGAAAGLSAGGMIDPHVLASKLKALELDPRIVDGKPAFVGASEELACRRDSTGRLVVDLEVTPREAQAVLDALSFMQQFEQRSVSCLSENCGFRFRPSPNVRYAEGELPPRVHAVVEIFGVTFTQGVNEMQTLANLSSSRDVLKQVEINNTGLIRMKDYYKAYREALEFQLSKYTPDMIDALAASQMLPPPPAGHSPSLRTQSGSPTTSSATTTTSTAYAAAAAASAAANGAAGGVRPSLSPAPQMSFAANPLKRRKSFLRPSVSSTCLASTSATNSPMPATHLSTAGGTSSQATQRDALVAAVVILKTKVLQHNDRYGRRTIFPLSLSLSLALKLMLTTSLGYWTNWWKLRRWHSRRRTRSMWTFYSNPAPCLARWRATSPSFASRVSR